MGVSSMLESGSKSAKTMPGAGEIVFVDEEPSTVVGKSESRSGPSDSQKAHYVQDILSAHLCLTAPDRDMVMLSMVGLEFQERLPQAL